MTDAELVEQAYSEIIKKLFGTFFLSFTEAGGNRALEQQAETIFSQGVAHARFVRDKAKGLLP